MKLIKQVVRVAIGSFLVANLWSIGLAQADTPAITLTTPGIEYDSSLYTLGFEFNVLSNTSVTQLGVYDSGQSALLSPASVGIWDTSGNLLVSGTVPAGTGGTLNGLFRYVSINPFTLSAGTNYIAGSYLSRGLASSIFIPSDGGTGSINPNVVIVQDQFSNFNSTFSFPDTTNSHPGGAWLGANFQVATVPEPETYGMMLTGLGLMGFMVRRKKSA